MRNCFTYYNPCLQLRTQSPRGPSETITVPHGVTRILTPKPSLSSVLLPSPFIKRTVTPEMTLKGQPLQRTLLPLTKGHHFTVVVFKSLSRVPLYDPMDCSPPGSSVHGNFPGKNIGVGCHFLLEGIFPTQWSNPHLLHWQGDSWPLNHSDFTIKDLTMQRKISNLLEEESYRSVRHTFTLASVSKIAPLSLSHPWQLPHTSNSSSSFSTVI